MGVVFGATDTTFDRRVALKVVSAALGDSDDFRRRFEREASLLARLNSPHVIAIFDYGVIDGCPYIATQYVGGGDLGGLVQARGAMPARLAARVCAQVADALHDAHRAGIVHRDVKPSNVLLRDADTVDVHAYLCDFGIARTAAEGLTSPGSVSGTWSYLAPECGKGAPGTPASDIYALGCLLWAALTGQAPYRGSDVEIAIAHQRSPVPQLVGDDPFTRQVNAILQRSLAKDAGQRYDDADRMRSDLLAATGLPSSGIHPAAQPSQPTPTPTLSGALGRLSLGPLPPTAPPLTPRPRRTAAVVAGVCVGVLIVTGGIVGLTQLGGNDSPTTTSDPTDDPTDDPTTATTAQPRQDVGGPITHDLDGDGFGDLSLQRYQTVTRRGESETLYEVTTWSSDGKQMVDRRTEPLPGRSQDARGRLAGDFDGDDQTDLLLTVRPNKSDDVTVSGELSDGTSVEATLTQPGPGRFATAFVDDVDGDGRDDLTLLSWDDQPPFTFATALFDGEGFGKPRKALQLPYDYDATSVEMGDVDGDGLADVATLSTRDTAEGKSKSRLEIYRGTGTDFVADGQKTFMSDIGPAFHDADLDGDEDQELLVIYGTENFMTLNVVDWRDGGPLRPQAWGLINLPTDDFFNTGIGVIDVNGDGLDDIVSVGPAPQENKSVLAVAESTGAKFAPPRSLGSWRHDLVDSFGPDLLGNTFP